MITYVDTSSLLKLLIEEEGSEQVSQLWDRSDDLVSVALIVVEGRAALAAAKRGQQLNSSQYQRARQYLSDLVDQLGLVEVTADLLTIAADLAEQEGLRGYDAVHLAAALSVSATVLTSADNDLCDAAERCGLHIANPLGP